MKNSVLYFCLLAFLLSACKSVTTVQQQEPMCLGTKSGFEYNAWLRNTSIKERTHYAASYTTTINTKKETN